MRHRGGWGGHAESTAECVRASRFATGTGPAEEVVVVRGEREERQGYDASMRRCWMRRRMIEVGRRLEQEEQAVIETGEEHVSGVGRWGLE